MTAPRMTPTNDAPVTVEPVAELIEMLQASTQEDGCCVFEHSAEEIGLHVMENTQAILAALASAPAGDGVPEDCRVVPILPTQEMLDAGCGMIPGTDPDPTAAGIVWTFMLAAAPAALARPRAAVEE